MTIDEAIKHCLEVAENNEAGAEWKGTTKELKQRCEECAAEHRQLAEWLTELRDRQWISVDDELPDTINDCLVWYSCDTAFGESESAGISFCSRGDWYTKKLDGDNIVVLYWQYLPEPPKENSV